MFDIFIGEDVWHAGIATHFCHSSKIPEIEKAILSLGNSNELEKVLNYFCSKPTSEFTLSKQIDQINKTFDASTVEEIFSNLEKDNSEWANQTIKVYIRKNNTIMKLFHLNVNYFQTLRTISPKSLKITLRELSIGKNMSLGECMQMEYRMRIRFTTEYNYREGTLVVDIR